MKRKEVSLQAILESMSPSRGEGELEGAVNRQAGFDDDQLCFFIRFLDKEKPYGDSYDYTDDSYFDGTRFGVGIDYDENDSVLGLEFIEFAKENQFMTFQDFLESKKIKGS